ncbi:hypothetical protein Pcinc_005421 [Petrolisthes cinctipes]|uniref:E3 ubiquitin-protein ligase n=1 Tax=Petrolisthes cinctipes TaxID=88211 RepID=A0AAE1GDD1_PETCI|nr:hypothetical protein Pcinc_005421 [Petrolisthes cinctipes]
MEIFRIVNYLIKQNLSFDIEKSEYLCPLCESLCNTALPLLPSVTWAATTTKYTAKDITLADWLTGLHSILRHKTVTISGARADDDDGHPGDAQMDTSPLRGSLPTPGPVGGQGGPCQGAPALPSPGAGSTSAFVVGVGGSGGASANTVSVPLCRLRRVGGQRGRPPRWGKLPLSKKHKKSDDESNLNTWTSPALAVVEMEMRSTTSLEATQAFAELFCNPAATTLPKFPPQTSEMMFTFAHAVYMHGLGVNPNVSSGRIPLLVWTSVAYTIHTLEQTQRNASRALLTALSTRQRDCLAALVKFAAHVPLCVKKKQTIESAALRLLSVILEGGDEAPCVLEWDTFSMLVTLTLSLPSIFPNISGAAIGSQQDLYLLQVVFLAHLVQLLLTYEETHFESEMDVDVSEECVESSSSGDSAWLVSMLTHCRTVAGLHSIKVNPQHLLDYIKERCLPFLRCCGLFFHFLTEVPTPEELLSSVWVPESEFYCLLRYLGLKMNHLRPTFNDPALQELVNRWCEDSRVGSLLGGAGSEGCVRSWTTINQLVSLPHDYSELINTVSQFPCPASSGDDSRTPTMCLVCGKMLCSQSYCCQTEFPEGSRQMVGACTYHAYHCGAGTGIFLRVRECKILLLSGRIKGCFVNPPYLDEYGETDQGLKRGNPLHLDAVQYSRLHSIWLSHAIPDTIAHTMESNSSVIATDWQHL